MSHKINASQFHDDEVPITLATSVGPRGTKRLAYVVDHYTGDVTYTVTFNNEDTPRGIIWSLRDAVEVYNAIDEG